jgi:hypothetical protein
LTKLGLVNALPESGFLQGLFDIGQYLSQAGCQSVEKPDQPGGNVSIPFLYLLKDIVVTALLFKKRNNNFFEINYSLEHMLTLT